MTDLSADELAALRENLSLEERAELDELLLELSAAVGLDR